MRELPDVSEFRAVTILLPVINETEALRSTVEIIEAEAGDGCV